MNWLWLNVPFDVVFFLAMAGVSLWVVIRHPDYQPAATDATGKRARAQEGIVTVAATTGQRTVPAEIRDRRELVGASAGDRG